MKKLLAVILLLCMLCGQALAIGDDIVLVEEHSVTYRDENGNLWSIGVYGVENWNEFAAAPTHISIMAMSNAGTPLQDLYYPLYPPVIAPMGRSYAVGIFCLDAEAQKDFSGLWLDFFPGSASEENAPAAYHLLPAESKVEGGKAVTTITNDTGAEMKNGKAVFLYRNELGEVVGACEMTFALAKDEVKEVEHSFAHAAFTAVESIVFDTDEHK